MLGEARAVKVQIDDGKGNRGKCQVGPAEWTMTMSTAIVVKIPLENHTVAYCHRTHK